MDAHTTTTDETIERLVIEARQLREGFAYLAAVADDLECLAAELVGRQQRKHGVCAYCGGTLSDHDDNWPPAVGRPTAATSRL